MNSFSEYMNRVKAEKELKEKTEAYVRAALPNAEYRDKNADSGTEYKKVPGRKLLVAISSLAACALLAFGGYAYYRTPVSYLCLDINPSVELGINAFQRVVRTEAYNEDGFRLLENNECMNLSVEDAVGILVQDAEAQGFIAEDGSTVIAVTVESDGKETAAKLQNSGEAGIDSALDTSETTAVVYSDCSDLQLREQAREAGVSPGKLRLIRLLQALDPGITVEEYQDAKITEIIIKANELMSQSSSTGWQDGDDSETLARIRDAAQQVQAAYANAEQEQNRNGGQNQNQGSGSGEENQNQNQNQNQGSDTETQQQFQNPDGGTDAQPSQSQGEADQTQNQNQSDTSDTGQKQGQIEDTQSGMDGTDLNNGNYDRNALDTEETTTASGGGSGSVSGAQTGNGQGGR